MARIKGFTLIEMSIVMVIIGLLIGGIIAGKDLIRAAEERAAISQITQFNIAVWNFENTYGGLPGDSRLSRYSEFVPRSGAASNGDGDGVIESLGQARQCGENVAFWSDLKRSGVSLDMTDALTTFQSSTSACYSPTLHADTTMNGYFPKSKFDEAFVMLQTGGDSSYASTSAVTKLGHVYLIARPLTMDFSAQIGSNQDVIPASSAFNFDTKIDDGSPTTGNVVNVTWHLGLRMYYNEDGSDCYDGDGYNVEEVSSNQRCSLAVKADF